MVDFTLAEASEILNPPLTERQLRDLVRLASLKPAGTRKNGHRGRPRPTYDAADLLKLHAVLAPFLRIPDA